MIRIFILLFCTGFLFSSCQQDVNSDATKTTTSTNSTSSGSQLEADPNADSNYDPNYDRLLAGNTSNPELTEIAKTVVKTMGSGFVESIDFQDGNVTLKYFDNAEEYNKINKQQQSPLAKEIFKSYWANGSRSDKVICIVPATLLKNLAFVQSVEVNLPTGEKVLSTKVTRESLAALTGKSWEDLVADWDNTYTNGIVRIPEGRARFMEALVNK